MSDYIRREDAFAACHAVIATRDNGVGTVGITWEDIKNLPAADVRINITGRWMESMETSPKGRRVRCAVCSACRNPIVIGDYKISYMDDYKFCPNCGADMRKADRMYSPKYDTDMGGDVDGH